jgi:hypothetical protein
MKKESLVVGVVVIVLLSAVTLYALTREGKRALEPRDVVAGVEQTFEMRSAAFRNGETIPDAHVLAGQNLSPPLAWSGAPPNVAAYALIVYDPDAPGGTFYHWLLYNIPAEVSELPEGLPRTGETEYGLQGRNDFGNIGYDGPHPPPGPAHRYVFLLLALDRRLDLPPGATPQEVLSACKGHVIAYAELMGLYAR